MIEGAVRTRRWTRHEYERLVDCEIFGSDDRIELLAGELIVKEPQHRPHVTAVQLVARALRQAFGAGWDVQIQAPLALDDESEPEPDVSVVPGDPRDYGTTHPTSPALVVEVSLSRLGFDREHKGSLYARARVPEYWIVNLPDRRLEIYREPIADAGAPFGWRYGRQETLGSAERVRILAPPGVEIAVADLLP